MHVKNCIQALNLVFYELVTRVKIQVVILYSWIKTIINGTQIFISVCIFTIGKYVWVGIYFSPCLSLVQILAVAISLCG